MEIQSENCDGVSSESQEGVFTSRLLYSKQYFSDKFKDRVSRSSSKTKLLPTPRSRGDIQRNYDVPKVDLGKINLKDSSSSGNTTPRSSRSLPPIPPPSSRSSVITDLASPRRGSGLSSLSRSPPRALSPKRHGATALSLKDAKVSKLLHLQRKHHKFTSVRTNTFVHLMGQQIINKTLYERSLK